ncbi:MAG: hypothetical protein HYW71_02595 [Candidatus Niyogibacteria bacterium]|nr:hypothetical protein [Candidatus Niyogibacteria bacterium]
MDGDENQRLMELQQARLGALETAKTPAQEMKEALSFGKKVSEHWLILGIAALFDLLALIPFASVFFNFCFGGVLFFYFGPKRKPGDSELAKIFLPIMAGSIFDFFISILPINIAAALIRIALS